MAEKAQLRQHEEAAAARQSPTHSASAAAGSSTPVAPPVSDSTRTGALAPDGGDLTPPPYSAPAPTTSHSSSPPANLVPQRRQVPKGPQRYPGLPTLDYRLYSPPLFELSADLSAIKSSAPYLSSGPSALVSLMRAQATVPPKPQVHITGRRGGHKVDFAIKLNLMSLLVPEDASQRIDYVRCVGADEPAFRGGPRPSVEPKVGGEGGLEEWARRFVEDDGAVKTFTLERVVANLDVGWLEGQIRSLVASTGYQGVVAVTFPVTHARVVVQNPDRVNRFFTNVTTLFTGRRRYEVVKAVWPFATHPNGDPARRCVVQSEETWWGEWKDPIRYAIATKRQGWVTNEDKLEAIMEGAGKGLSTVDWGPEY